MYISKGHFLPFGKGQFLAFLVGIYKVVSGHKKSPQRGYFSGFGRF
jgi:hypothetical protein